MSEGNSSFSTVLPGLQIACDRMLFGFRVPAKRINCFLHKLKQNGTCWNYTGPKLHNGYGAFGIGGREGTNVRAHRFSYALWRDWIPEGKQVLHTCDNRLCCNPDHLFLGTNLDNMLDKIAKRRHLKNGAVRRVLPETVIQMQEMRKDGWSNVGIGIALGFSHETVRVYLNCNHPKHFSYDS